MVKPRVVPFKRHCRCRLVDFHLVLLHFGAPVGDVALLAARVVTYVIAWSNRPSPPASPCWPLIFMLEPVFVSVSVRSLFVIHCSRADTLLNPPNPPPPSTSCLPRPTSFYLCGPSAAVETVRPRHHRRLLSLQGCWLLLPPHVWIWICIYCPCGTPRRFANSDTPGIRPDLRSLSSRCRPSMYTISTGRPSPISVNFRCILSVFHEPLVLTRLHCVVYQTPQLRWLKLTVYVFDLLPHHGLGNLFWRYFAQRIPHSGRERVEPIQVWRDVCAPPSTISLLLSCSPACLWPYLSTSHTSRFPTPSSYTGQCWGLHPLACGGPSSTPTLR